ncbi:MAG: hypothetical protein ACFBRM_05370 [Pikeienuella sp.]
MIFLKRLALPIAAAAAFFAFDLRVAELPSEMAGETARSQVTLSLGSQAEASPYRRSVRRTARRTARRTTARQNYIRSLPGGCALRGAYHYCGGVYYQPVVQGGATVYVVVYP